MEPCAMYVMQISTLAEYHDWMQWFQLYWLYDQVWDSCTPTNH